MVIAVLMMGVVGTFRRMLALLKRATPLAIGWPRQGVLSLALMVSIFLVPFLIRASLTLKPIMVSLLAPGLLVVSTLLVPNGPKTAARAPL